MHQNITIATQDPPAELLPVQVVEYAQMSDELLAQHAISLKEERERVADMLSREYRAIVRILEDRLIERGAKAIPSQTHTIELVDKWTPYSFDVDKLREAKRRLPDDEAKKILVHVPEKITVVNAHDEPGPAVSINTLARKYAGSEVGDLLASGLKRTFIGHELSIKERKA